MSDRQLIAAILDVMERDRGYEAATLKDLFPSISMDTLRAAMHALWLDRHVERVGASGWKGHESRSNGQSVPTPTASPSLGSA